MSQCVPNWDTTNQLADSYNHQHHHNPPAATETATKLIPSRNDPTTSNNVLSTIEVPILDYEVTELTWENGQLAIHGLGQPRFATKALTATASTPWPDNKQQRQPGSSGTLEAIVNQGTCFFTPSNLDETLPPCFPRGNDLIDPWFNHHHATAASANNMTTTMDALVPLCTKNNNNHIFTGEESNGGGVAGLGGCPTNIGSCSTGMNREARKQRDRQVPFAAQDLSTRSQYSVSASTPQVTLDTYTERDQGTAFTSTSIWSADNVSSGMPACTKLTGTGDDHDSICHSRSLLKDDGGSGETKKKGSSSAKRSRAAAIHNQSERKRRDKINQKIKTLQKLVPNSSKIDKASMLDEVIDYLKQLQAQVTMINRMNMPQMMMPAMTLNQQLQMSMMSQMAGAAAMGMGGMFDTNNVNLAAMAGGLANIQPLLHPSAFMPMQSPWDAAQALMPDPMISAFHTCQSQPMTMDTYRMMASIYQQMQHQGQTPNPNSKS